MRDKEKAKWAKLTNETAGAVADAATKRRIRGTIPRIEPGTAINLRYYDLRRNWRKVKPHLDNPRVADTLVRDFNRFTWGRWRQQFTAGHTPFEFETCDWWCEHRGRRPAFWNYVKHAACHWIGNFSLELAQLVEPKRQWRIITSDEHSTVWDGKDTLFDFNFQALGITPADCFKAAARHSTSRELKPGQHERIYFAEHFSHEKDRLLRR